MYVFTNLFQIEGWLGVSMQKWITLISSCNSLYDSN